MSYISAPVISNRYHIEFKDSISDTTQLSKMSIELVNAEFDFLNHTVTLMFRQPVESMDMAMALSIFGVADDSKIVLHFMDLIGKQGGMSLSGLKKISHTFKLDYKNSEPANHVVTWQFAVMESLSVKV